MQDGIIKEDNLFLVISTSSKIEGLEVASNCGGLINLSVSQSVFMETSVEDKFITVGSFGVESNFLDVDTNQEPYEGMLFESDEAAKAFYDEYARKMGFSTRIVSSRKSERDGSIISRRLACNKEGYNLNSQKTGRIRIRKRESKREGCMAMILVKREKAGKWIVKKFVREHNHPLVISPREDLPTPDDKDQRIKELTFQLNHTNQQLAACREQLRTIMTIVEEQTECLSRTVADIVSNVKEVELEGQKLPHHW